MNRLSKEKRDQLILVIISTLAVLLGIYFILIRPQYATIARIQRDIKTAQDKQLNMENIIKRSSATTSALFDISDTLSHAEEDMAYGDPFSWTVDFVRHFKVNYKVDIPTVSQPTTGDEDLFTDFPYKQLKFNISGTAYYHDIGKFVSDLENRFPHMRVVNIVMEPVNGTGDDANEKLSFRMDIIALIKSSVAAK